jgi:uncharacterized membrane protein YhaH (DUF805 family)
MKWYLEVLKKYAVFSGRASRKEFWMFVLFNLIITAVLGFVEGLLGLPVAIHNLYGLAVLVPTIAVSVRRLHDTGKSGKWFLLALIPIVGLILIAYYVQDSQEGQNEYGPNPKLAAA